jgi:hypothetical protein
VDGLETVTDVRQGARHDDRHGIVQIRGADFLFDGYRNDLARGFGITRVGGV